MSESSGELTRRPSRHVWVGNLHTRVSRTALKAAMEPLGAVEDVVVFPGRMYAFVNFKTVEDATRAVEALDNQVVSAVRLVYDNRLDLL